MNEEGLPENAAELIGREFVHFKGGHYRLHGFAKDSETLETMVVYEALYGKDPLPNDFGVTSGGPWVRPAKMFFGEVTRDGKTFRRFELFKPCSSYKVSFSLQGFAGRDICAEDCA